MSNTVNFKAEYCPERKIKNMHFNNVKRDINTLKMFPFAFLNKYSQNHYDFMKKAFNQHSISQVKIVSMDNVAASSIPSEGQLIWS